MPIYRPKNRALFSLSHFRDTIRPKTQTTKETQRLKRVSQRRNQSHRASLNTTRTVRTQQEQELLPIRSEQAGETAPPATARMSFRRCASLFPRNLHRKYRDTQPQVCSFCHFAPKSQCESVAGTAKTLRSSMARRAKTRFHSGSFLRAAQCEPREASGETRGARPSSTGARLYVQGK